MVPKQKHYKLNAFKKYILFSVFFLFLNSYFSAQINLVVDTILLPGHNIQKVSATRSSDVWIIEDTNSRNIYRIDKNLAIYNHTAAFQSLTGAKFTAIFNNDTSNTLVGTSNDYVYHWINGNIFKRAVSNGILDSTINGISGYAKTPIDPQLNFIGVSANTLRLYYSNNSVNYTVTPTNTSMKTLEYGIYQYFGPQYYDYRIHKHTLVNGEEQVTVADASATQVYGNGLNWHNINTAETYNKGLSAILVGSDTKLVASAWGVFSTHLTGFKISKVVKYRYDSQSCIVASDSGLYIFNFFPNGVVKAAFPENTFIANDVSVSPDGCVWVATNVGLFKLKDSNCMNYATDYTITDTLLTLGDSCIIQFNGQCPSCTETWNWSFGDGVTSTLTNPSHSYANSGTYSVSLVAGNGLCTDTITKNVTILVCCDSSNYDLFTLGNDFSVCQNTVLTAPGFANCTYLWSTGDTTASIQITSSGNYSLTIKNQNGCLSTDEVYVTIKPSPLVSISGLSSSYCEMSSPMNLTGLPSGGSFTIDGTSNSSFVPGSIGVGPHVVSYSYTAANGCSNFDSDTVVVNTNPVVNISGLDSAYCNNANLVHLTASPAGGVYSGIGVSGNLLNPSHVTNGNTSVIYTYTDSNNCSNSDTEQVVVYPLPILSLTGISENYFTNSGIQNIITTPPGGLLSGNGITGTTFDPSVVLPGTYAIVYTYTDANACSNTIEQSVTVLVDDRSELFIPDAFSPNGDGQNDILYIRGFGIQEFNLSIYDRLGEKVFETKSLNDGWNGTYKGVALNSAVFVYYLSAKLNNGEQIKTKGDITLTR